MNPRIVRQSRCKGATLVETALCLTVTLILLLGVMELGLTLYGYHSTSAAAREGSRWASVRGSASCSATSPVTNCNATAANIKTYVGGLGYYGITSGGVTVLWCNPPTGGTVDTTCSATNTPGNLVKVKVTESTNFALPLITKNAISMQSTAQMPISQ